MAASSVTGTGLGKSHKETADLLDNLEATSKIVAAGTAETSSDGLPSSPPSDPTVVVTFESPLPLPSNRYVVILTAVNGSDPAYVSDLSDNDDDQFESFSITCASECDVNYIVIKK